MNLFRNVDESWIPFLHSLAYQEPLVSFLDNLSSMSFQPDFEKIFRVFEIPLEKIKVVIIGQDPYPIPGMSEGYAFVVSGDNKLPRAVKNIYERIEMTDNDNISSEGPDMSGWPSQGVFLLNSALTVRTGEAGSHLEHWRNFTESVVKYISSNKKCVWLLMGWNSRSFEGYINNPFNVNKYDEETINEIPIDIDSNYVICTDSPYFDKIGSFKNSNCFKYINKILEKKSLNKIIW